MRLLDKKQKLAAIKQEFEQGMYTNGKVENIGAVFFLYHTGACVLRDVVYYRSQHYDLEFETLCMTSSYFVGTKAHAEALLEAFGGRVYPSEYCALAENARELYIWEGPKRQEQALARGNAIPLDYEEVKMVLF